MYVINLSYSIAYATTHAFYPNFSKFLQQNYKFSNEEAGHLSSIPYIFSSVAVPLMGHILGFTGGASYSKFLVAAAILTFMAHSSFFVLNNDVDETGKIN